LSLGVASNGLSQLADALVQHETLDMEEVKKVIKGESIRAIEQVVEDDLARMTESISNSQ
jgi:ATP-dependent metalloprotease